MLLYKSVHLQKQAIITHMVKKQAWNCNSEIFTEMKQQEVNLQAYVYYRMCDVYDRSRFLWK